MSRWVTVVVRPVFFGDADHLSTRIKACEAILAKYGFVHGLHKEISEVHLAIRAHGPENPGPSEAVDFSTYTQAQLDEALVEAGAQIDEADAIASNTAYCIVPQPHR